MNAIYSHSQKEREILFLAIHPLLLPLYRLYSSRQKSNLPESNEWNLHEHREYESGKNNPLVKYTYCAAAASSVWATLNSTIPYHTIITPTIPTRAYIFHLHTCNML